MLALLISVVSCWWGGPHITIARIAEKKITSAQSRWLTELLSQWPSEAGSITSLASWQDDLHGSGVFVMKQWHFSNEPIVKEPFVLTNPPSVFNISGVVDGLINTVLNPSTTSKWALNFAIRSLVHFIGDCHTPLHTAGLWSEEYPEGDVGGNKFNIKCNYGQPCNNLHMMWDSAVLDMQNSPPYNGAVLAEFERNVSSIMDNYPASSITPEYDTMDVSQWLHDPYKVAVSHSYGLIVQPNIIDDNYVRKGRVEALKLISLAGHRLGHVLNKFFELRGTPELNPASTPASTIVVWVLDSLLLVVCAVYTVLLILKPNLQAQPLMERSESSMPSFNYKY